MKNIEGIYCWRKKERKKGMKNMKQRKINKELMKIKGVNMFGK